MKKFLLSIGIAGLALSSANVSAQSFSLEHTTDTVKVAITKSNFDVYNKITNTSANPIKIDWRVISNDFPADWGDSTRLGMCDNLFCRTNGGNQLLNGSTHSSLDYAPGVPGDWHFQFVNYLSVTPGTHYATIEYKVNGSTFADTTTFVFTVWPTSITGAEADKDFMVLYPNPATDKLNISFGENTLADQVTIHNYVGKQVLSQKVVNKNMVINIKQIPVGMYYIRVSDSKGRVFGTKRFTHR